MSDFPATKKDTARAASRFDALRARGYRHMIQGDVLKALGLSFLLVIGIALLPSGSAQSQFIPPAHQSVLEVDPDEGYRKPGEPDNEYLSLVNESDHRLSINYRTINKNGECSQLLSEELGVGSRLDLPFMHTGLTDAEQAASVRYCAEYDDLAIQRLSGYGSCGTMPAGCGGGDTLFSHVVAPVYNPGYLILSPDTLTIEEGMEETFTVSLSNIPTSTVTLSLVRQRGNRDIALDTGTLTFTPSDWNVAQTVTVSVAEDVDADDEMENISIIVKGDNYADDVVTVKVIDKDKLTGGLAYEITGVVPHGRDYKLAIPEGESGHDITIRLVAQPTQTVTMTLKVVGNEEITVDPSELMFTRSDWDSAQTVTINAVEDDDKVNDAADIVISTVGGNYSGSYTMIAVTVEDSDHPAKPPAPSGPAIWPLQAEIFAIPPTGVRDQAVARIRCVENDQGGCRVYLDCTDEGGSPYTGLAPPIESGSTIALTSRDIVNITGRSWENRGRLACAIRSELPISAQIWTRSGNAVLVSNNEYIRSQADSNHRQVAGIYSIPSPDSSRDVSNIRIRCSPYTNHCTNTVIRCFDDEGNPYQATIGTIRRSIVRFMQTQELSDMIDHRWQGMGLSCEVQSDSEFTVQVLTRTGGGALINNSAQAAAPYFAVPLVTPDDQDTRTSPAN
ncbi:COG1470 family protein [Thioalkalivibrio sp. HK1]|uniref:COG1470 family protein n=1 Tax=Thioalkalivibrio sp. HK1 TaxID=1469245 RepID=UPI0004B3537C|nr:hypothetical protein [Thioalkalivibrio sp. HK1]